MIFSPTLVFAAFIQCDTIFELIFVYWRKIISHCFIVYSFQLPTIFRKKLYVRYLTVVSTQI